MGKKLIEKMNHMYPKFIEGGKANGHDPKVLEKIWEDWRAFASYAFNKSHATCYSWVAYQTAYLKANYPAQYMAAVMSRSLADIKSITKFMDECKSMGIRTLGPDVNESRHKFSVNSTGSIRFGMGAIKGVGEGAVTAIIEEREKNGLYKSVFDFVERINLTACNKKCIENLALAGAFDSFGEVKREQFFESDGTGTYIDTLVRYGLRYQQDKASAANSLFGDGESVEIAKPAPPADFVPWTDLKRLNKERDLIGIYISGHPLDEFSIIVKHVCKMAAAQLEDVDEFSGQEVTIGGIVTDIREGQTRNGKPYGIVKIEDYSGAGEIALFGDEWARWRGYMAVGNSLFITGRVEPRQWNPNANELRIGRVEFLADIKDKMLQKITIMARIEDLESATINDLHTLLEQEKGQVEVYFRITDSEQQATVTLKSATHRINVSKALLDYLEGHHSLSFQIN